MQAFQIVEHGSPGRFEFGAFPDPEPAQGEVLVRVGACGLNRLDLWTEQGSLPIPVQLPRIPGCEIAGEVVALGNGVTRWRVGDRVAVQSNLFCGECEFCARGRESICIRGEILGVHRNGGFAEFVAVPSSALVHLHETIPFETSAALTLAGSTAMHMLTSRVRVRSGDWVLVIGGASGVGSAAIQIAKGLGAYVISTGSTEKKRALAMDLGANHVVDSTSEHWPSDVRKLTGKRGADFVVEHVGGEVLLKAFDCLARGGTIVTCGATQQKDVAINVWSLFVKEQSLVGSYGRNQKDIETTLQWVAEGRMRPVIDTIYPLDET